MIFGYLQRRKARIKAKEEALKLLDENLAKIVANLVRIAVIERDKETRFEIWEREIVEWLNEIYRKCENLEYRYRIRGVEYYDAIKRAFIKPKVVIDTALMDFCDDDLYESDESKADFRTLESISYDRLHRMIYDILCEQFKIMKELNWHKKTFTRDFRYSAIKWRKDDENN